MKEENKKRKKEENRERTNNRGREERKKDIKEGRRGRRYAISNSAGGMLPMGSRSRRLLNQSTHSRVAYSTLSTVRQGPRLWITSVFYKPLMVSARALS